MIALNILLLFPLESLAWTNPRQVSSYLRNSQRTSSRFQSLALAAASGPFFGPEEEFECGDEEECEIDWDAMPGFDDDSAEEENFGFEDEEEEVEVESMTFGDLARGSLEKQRTKMEMGWQIDECEMDEDLCEDFCPDCAGGGKQPCRFCRGTSYIVFGDQYRPCLICSAKGKEDCASCKGTGKIAPWATTMEKFLNGFKLHTVQQ